MIKAGMTRKQMENLLDMGFGMDCIELKKHLENNIIVDVDHFIIQHDLHNVYAEDGEEQTEAVVKSLLPGKAWMIVMERLKSF